MSSLQESLLNSFEILAKGYIQQSPSTTVIEGTVSQIIDASIGQYKIQYLNNTLIAYTSNFNIHFNIGDKVYVLVPNGDFAKHKLILGLSNPNLIINDNDIDGNIYELLEKIKKECKSYCDEQIRILREELNMRTSWSSIKK